MNQKVIDFGFLSTDFAGYPDEIKEKFNWAGTDYNENVVDICRVGGAQRNPRT